MACFGGHGKGLDCWRNVVAPCLVTIAAMIAASIWLVVVSNAVSRHIRGCEWKSSDLRCGIDMVQRVWYAFVKTVVGLRCCWY